MDETYPESELTGRIIGAAIAVHRALGPGLLEAAYKDCLAVEFAFCGLAFQKEQALPLIYRGKLVATAYRYDFVVEGRVLLELKAIEKFAPIHTTQVLTYLKISRLRVALLVNFNAVPLKSGIKRLIQDP